MKVTFKATGAGLCHRCEEGQVIVDVRGVETVICHFNHPPMQMRVPVVSCSEHTPKGQMSKYDARKIGWILERKKGGQIGFRPPTENEKHDRV